MIDTRRRTEARSRDGMGSCSDCASDALGMSESASNKELSKGNNNILASDVSFFEGNFPD